MSDSDSKKRPGKRLRWLIGGGLVLILITAAFTLKPPRKSDLPSLLPYIAKERTLYINPAELYKGIPSMKSPSYLQPYEVHMIRTHKMTFSQLSDAMHHDLSSKRGWVFRPPRAKTPNGVYFRERIVAYKDGTSGSSGIVAPELWVDAYIKPPNNTSIMDLKTGQPEVFVITERRYMSNLEVQFLKWRSMGKSPFASEEERSKMYEGL